MEKGLQLNLDQFSPKLIARVSMFSPAVKKHHTVSFSKEDIRSAFNNNIIDDDDNKMKERINKWSKQQNNHKKSDTNLLKKLFRNKQI